MKKDDLAQPNICPDCGHKNRASETHCTKCGTGLLLSVQPQPQPQPQPWSQPQPSRSVPKKRFYPPFVKKVSHMDMRLKIIAICLLVFIIIIPVLVFVAPRIRGDGKDGLKVTPGPAPTPTQVFPQVPKGLGEFTTSNGQNIGVNDGSFAPFDIGRDTQEMAFKQQAATALKQGNAQAAISLWYQALSIESNDAESLIYLEDQHVLTSRKPYVTLIAGTSFTPPFPDGQYEEELQGIYVAQHEFNQNHQAFQVRVLIANLGNSVETGNMLPVIRQITQIAVQDTTVVGIIGWLNSSSTLNALSAFGKFKDVKIPIISPQASSDHLSGSSPYFFRVVAPNKVQAQAAAQFMKNILHVKKPVVFVDPNDQYSQNLAQDFEGEFAAGGHLPEVVFKTDSIKNFSSLVQNALQYQPDAFYFTSPSSVDAGNFQNALPTTGNYATIPAVGGDGGYSIQRNGFNRWYFTEYAYHGESTTPIATQFAQEYTSAFDSGLHPQKPAGFYGYSLAGDHAILAYDATSVALTALIMAYTNGKPLPTSQDLANTLPTITGAKAFQGVSGQIAFGSDHDPINKAIVILFASKDGHTQLYNIQGCFMKGCP